MSEKHSDGAVRHAVCRGHNANAHSCSQHSAHSCQQYPQQYRVICDADQFRQQLDTGRWSHVGTSPRLSTNDRIQARRRFQVFMADQ